MTRTIGIGVIGGMLTATALGVIFVPIFFVWVLSRGSRREPGPDADTPTRPSTHSIDRLEPETD